MSGIYNRVAMKTPAALLFIALASIIACNKSAGPASSSSAAPSSGGSSSSGPSDAVQQKLQEYSGASATDCGRLDVRATADRSKAASGCAVRASQGKHPFYVAYDMPGMTVGVAGNADGKLFTVQSQSGAVTSGDCPSQLRVASSGRVTCFAPGDMGSMSGSHAAGAMAPETANPHAGGAQSPHSSAPAQSKN
jgi:hypothetical protein